MADIRIKDLTTTASTTAADDFFAADGTTNGTRKLSAFSPSFGGNATVGGTLTVSGAGSSAFATTTGFSISTGVTTPSGGVGVGAIGTGGSFYVNTPSLNSNYGSGLAIDGSYPGGTGAQSVVNVKAFGVMSGGGYGSTLSFQTTLNGTFNEVMKLTSGSVVQVLGTTASTTTSSGALVVGNGTSGGLGVGGAIFCGSLNATADSKISSAAAKTSSADTLKIATATGGSSDFELLISRSAAGSGAYYSIQSVEQATGYRGLVLQKDGGNVLIGGTTDISGNGGLKVFGTTASTSTSSGALVVSGGVGVAGAIYAGGAINSTQTISGNDLVATAGYAEIKGYGGTAGNGILFLGQSANNNFISGTSSNMTFRLSNTTRLTVDATDITVASGTALKLGNAYVAGAPTATGYIVIKDSTGTSYKIPAVAL